MYHAQNNIDTSEASADNIHYIENLINYLASSVHAIYYKASSTVILSKYSAFLDWKKKTL